MTGNGVDGNLNKSEDGLLQRLGPKIESAWNDPPDNLDERDMSRMSRKPDTLMLRLFLAPAFVATHLLTLSIPPA
jgi:hypothetical protein